MRCTKHRRPFPAVFVSFRGREPVTERRKVFSGVQPTGNMHIGNYLGAFRNWVALQEDYDAIYCVVDLHALTVPVAPEVLYENRLDAARVLLAVGVDPDRFAVLSPEPGPPARRAVVDFEHDDAEQRSEPHDPVQGEIGPRGRQPGPLLVSRFDGGGHTSPPRRPGARWRRPAPAPRNDTRPSPNDSITGTAKVFPIPDALIPETSSRVMSLARPYRQDVEVR